MMYDFMQWIEEHPIKAAIFIQIPIIVIASIITTVITILLTQ